MLLYNQKKAGCEVGFCVLECPLYYATRALGVPTDAYITRHGSARDA